MSAEAQALMHGALSTLEVSVVGAVFGIMIAVMIALLRQAALVPARWIAAAYVSFIRGTPLFVQILVVYFLLPGVGLDLSPLQSGMVALSLNSGAYISEMIRGALTAIPPGQVEAAQALAIPRRWIWLRIILPQVAVLIVPPLTVELAALIKGSALLSVVGVVELTRSAQQIIAVTFEPLGTWAKVAFLYFLMCFALGQLTRQLQRLKTTGLAV
jgi:His/Glu/Gln/Arg/opine family amino acid ABC transporter permease subunit